MERGVSCTAVSITVAKDCQGSTARQSLVQSCIQILGPVIINQWCSLVILFSIITSLILLVMMMHPRKPSYRWNSNPFLAANYMVGCRLVVEDGTDVVLFNASNEISLQFKSQHHHYLQSWSPAKKTLFLLLSKLVFREQFKEQLCSNLCPILCTTLSTNFHKGEKHGNTFLFKANVHKCYS